MTCDKKILSKVGILLMAISFPFMAIGYDEVRAYDASDISNTFKTDLIANGGSPSTAIDVGDVFAWNDGQDLFIKYLIVDPAPMDLRDNWCISVTHVAVATSLSGIPQTRTGNPQVGKFEYKKVHSPCVTDYTYQIPLSTWGTGTKLFIATHAGVQTQYVGLSGFTAILPNSATVSVTFPVPGGSSYFPGVTVTNDGFLNGVYGG
jgi:hypothetical protein